MMQRKVQLFPKLRSESDLIGAQERQSFRLLKREELNAKKSRVEHVLVQQYVNKYGSKDLSSKINDLIKSIIKEFLDQLHTALISEEMIASLESDIREATTKMRSSKQTTSSETKSRQKSSDFSNSIDFNGKSNARGQSGDDDKIFAGPEVQHRDVDRNQWSVVSAILALSDEEQKLKEHKTMMAKKDNFKNELDKQSILMRAREAEAKEERLKLAEAAKSTTSKYEEDTRNMKQLLEARIKKERLMRLSQIEERQILKEQERLKKAAIEDVEVAQIRKLTLEEENQRLMKKEYQRKIAEALKEEDRQNRSVRATKITAQREYEHQLSKDYATKMEREEQERANCYKDRMEAASLRACKAQPVDEGLTRAEERRTHLLKTERCREEKVANEEFSRRLEDDVDKERVKAEARRKEIARSSEFNLQMIDRKEQRKQQEREDASTYRRNMERDAEALRAADKLSDEKKRMLMWEVKHTLDEQVKNFNNRKVSEKVLSEKEVALNKGFFEKVQSDPDLREKLYAKLNPQSLSSDSRKTPSA